MELINFTAWFENRKVLTAKDIDATSDQLIIGKRVNNKKDGSEFRTFAMSVQELLDLVASTPVTAFKSYKALLTKDDLVVASPVVIVKENSIGAVVWTRQSSGVYIGTLTGAFPAGARVFARGGTTQSVDDSQWIIYNVKRLTNNTVVLTGFDVQNQEAAVDGDFYEVPVEIIVYPS